MLLISFASVLIFVVWFANSVTFLFLGILRRTTNDYYSYLDRIDSFAAFDKDNDSKLSKNEVTDALTLLFQNLDEKEAEIIGQEIISVADQDGDSHISFSEYGLMLNEIRKYISA